MFKAKPKSDKANLLKKVVLAILPGLAVFGLVFAANTYYDIDLRKIIIEESQKIIGQLETTATTTLATISGFVGIGTTTPATTLQVYGTSTFVGGKVGIGTTGPTAALTFADGSTINSQGTLTINSNTTNALTLDSGTTGAINIGISASGKAITLGNSTATTSLVIDSGTGGINIGTSTVARTINIGTGAAVVQTINLGGTGANVVGIGNTQTGGSLSFGAAMTTGTITIGGTGAQTGILTFGTSTGINIVSVGTGSGATTLNLATGVTNAKTINIGTGAAMANNIAIGGTGGNIITIGNTQTAGSISMGAAMTTGTITIGGTGAQTGILTFGTSTGINIVSVGTGSGATTLNLATGVTNAKTINIGTGAAMANNIAIGGTGGNIITIGNTQTAGSISMGAAMTTGTITIGGTGLQTGTIGIGIGTGAQIINLGTGGTGAKTVALGSTAATSSVTIQSGTGHIMLMPTGAGKVGIGTTTPSEMLTVWGGAYFGTSTTPALYIASSTGRVGVGTSSPATMLQVYGRIRMNEFQLGTSATSSYVLTTDASGVGTWQAAAGGLSGGQANYIPLWTGATTQGTSTIYQSGTYIGIGTTTPASTLTVYGTSTFMGGKVGIGTTTPAYALDVYGTSRFGSGTSTQVILRGYVQSNIIPYQDATYNLGSSNFRWGNIYAATATIGSTLTINSNTISGSATTTLTTTAGALILNPSGYVGIGTTTPAYGLDIWGTLRAAHVSTTSGSVIDSFSDETKIAVLSSVVVSAGQAELSQSPCGDYTVTFTYRGIQVTYGTASSSGKCWLDRNLGASGVATSSTDSAAYGDLFQWGREDDGHQVRSPAPGNVEGDMTLTSQPGHANFITEQTSPWDWATTTWITRWTVADDDPCPTGWRVPTDTEWNNERLSWSPNNNSAGAFASPLKLTLAGYRYYSDASLINVDSDGFYWSSVATGDLAYYLYFGSSDAYMNYVYRAFGFSVRCLKD